MKILNTYILYLLIILSATSCDNEAPIKESQLDTETPDLSPLDIWIRENYIRPYNIEVLYKWEDGEVDRGRYLYPPTENNVQPLMEIVLDIWINSYNELGGDEFVKVMAPRQVVLVGGHNVNPSGTRTLGLAESGMKITLFEVDELDLQDKEKTRRFFKTIQHEYCHILNQTKPYTPEYGKITPGGYDGSWHLFTVEEAREQGFITNYAKSNDFEDFAEMTSIMLTYSNDEYEAILNSIQSDEGRAAIRAKEDIVATYFSKEWGINIYNLQDLTFQKLIELTN
ncbi:zinc-binding metallopeptidase [Sinomicrobium soli]|uniref:zinc-binding metallopeptidase n=1 Tax=Sinomicrobium sp. N-1-3-6 TaxID=2219864 RepID=UPI000DCED6BD|nr:putative zinc-binding metallopeptidase [Sinomicrobium sp. N-1-3-6]RAV27610.1 hypothetical protein DN748_17630 [Sinomicrobium sp. N-1-3-6]